MSLGPLLSISLSPDLKEFIEQRVASGQNVSADDVVREALVALKTTEHDIDSAFDELKAQLHSAAQEEQLETSLIDGDSFMDDLLTRLQQRRNSSGAA